MSPWGGNELLTRALAAYFKFPGEAILDQPSESLSAVKTHKKKEYVVLANGHRTLAVYRVRTDGVLKRLKRWPSDLDE